MHKEKISKIQKYLVFFYKNGGTPPPLLFDDAIPLLTFLCTKQSIVQILVTLAITGVNA